MPPRKENGRGGQERKRGADAKASADPAWLTHINEAEITAVEATGYLHLGEPASAEVLFRIALSGALFPRNRALYTARLAASLLAQGRLDEAFEVGGAVLTALENGISSRLVLEALRPVYDAAKATEEEGDPPGEPEPGGAAAGQGELSQGSLTRGTAQETAASADNRPRTGTGKSTPASYGTRA